MVEISVVIPVYRSEGCLSELNRQIIAALQQEFTFELILVDDQSPDNSWHVISQLVAEHSHIIGIRLRKNSGQDNAIMCGLAQSHGRFIVIMDDDLQHSPFDIPVLHHECRSRNIDVCYARFLRKKQAMWKNLGSWLNGKVAQIVIGKPPDIYLSPYKIIRRDVVEEILRYSGPYPYVDGLLYSVTNSIGQTDIENHARFSGTSNYNLTKSILVFLKVAINFSVIPLRISSCLGMISAACGFLLAAYYVYAYFFKDEKVVGWTTLAVLILIIGGLAIFSIGIVGEYLGRMYLHISGRPQYVVGEILRADRSPPAKQ